MQQKNGTISRWGAGGRALPRRKLSGERGLRRARNFSGEEVPWGARISTAGSRTVSFSTALLSLLSSLGPRPPDLCVRSAGHSRILLSTFSTPLSRPPAAGPLCPLRWAFIRRHPHRWVANPRGPENPIRSHTDIARKGTRTSAAGGRTSVSAPLSVHPRILAPMGSQSAWAVRAAGRSSEDRRTSGQRTRVEWKRRS